MVCNVEVRLNRHPFTRAKRFWMLFVCLVHHWWRSTTNRLHLKKSAEFIRLCVCVCFLLHPLCFSVFLVWYVCHLSISISLPSICWYEGDVDNFSDWKSSQRDIFELISRLVARMIFSSNCVCSWRVVKNDTIGKNRRWKKIWLNLANFIRVCVCVCAHSCPLCLVEGKKRRLYSMQCSSIHFQSVLKYYTRFKYALIVCHHVNGIHTHNPQHKT